MTLGTYAAAHYAAQRTLQMYHRELMFLKSQCHKGGRWPHKVRHTKQQYAQAIRDVEKLLKMRRPEA